MCWIFCIVPNPAEGFSDRQNSAEGNDEAEAAKKEKTLMKSYAKYRRAD
jgi:hypothetical protein